MRPVGHQHHTERSSVTHFAQHVVEHLPERRLISRSLFESRIERREFSREVELPDFDLLAELLPAWLILFEIGPDRLEAAGLVGHVGRVHAPADIGQHEQLHRRLIGLRLLQSRAKHGEDQREDRQQPQPQQHPSRPRGQGPQLRAVCRHDEHCQPDTRQHNDRPRPDGFDAQRHLQEVSSVKSETPNESQIPKSEIPIIPTADRQRRRCRSRSGMRGTPETVGFETPVSIGCDPD